MTEAKAAGGGAEEILADLERHCGGGIGDDVVLALAEPGHRPTL